MAIHETTPPPCTRSGAAPARFLPRAFIEAVTDAVLPLVDGRNGTRLIEGRTPYDVRRALLPLFGDYTVEDAVHVHRMLRHADGHWRPRGDKDDPRAHAIYEAREVLVHFICHAQSSGPACAAARAAFAYERDGDGDDLPSELYNALHFRICGDIDSLRGSGFAHGERLAGGTWACSLQMEAPPPVNDSDDVEGDQ